MAVIASDSFTGTDGTNWGIGTIWTGGTYPTGSSSVIISNAGRLTTGDGTAGSARVARLVNITPSAPVDAVVLFKFRWPTGDECYPRWYMRVSNQYLDTEGGYYIELNRSAGNFTVGKGSGYSSTSLPTGGSGDAVNKTFDSGAWYWCRFGVVGDQIKARVWNDGATEPAGWDVQATDSSITTANLGTGITLGTGSVQNGKFDIDEMSIDTAFPANPSVVAAEVGTATFQGLTATATYGFTKAVETGTATFQGRTANVSAGRTVAAEVGTATFQGHPAQAGQGQIVQANIGAATFSGLAGNVTVGATVAAAKGAATFSGLTGTASIPVTVEALTGTANFQGREASAYGLKDFVRVGTANIRVTYRDLITGRPCAGAIRFTPAAYISTDDLLVPNRVSVLLDGTGSLDVDLPCGKDQLTLPLVAYLVEELLEFPSVGRPPFYLLLTPADDGQIVDLAIVSMEVNVPDLSLYMLKEGGTFTGPVTVASTFNATGNVTLAQSLAVGANIVATNLDLTGSADMDGSLTVGGSADIEGGLNVGEINTPAYSGGQMTGDLDVSGEVSVGQDVVVAGGATVGGNVSIAGQVLGELKLPVLITFPDGESLEVVDGTLKFTGGTGTVTTIAPA